MSKEKVNPGENCPFCLTVTKPGSSVCTSCGANRVFAVIKENFFFITALNLLVKFVAIILALVSVFQFAGDHIAWGMLSIASIALVVFGATYLEKCCSEYMWERQK